MNRVDDLLEQAYLSKPDCFLYRVKNGVLIYCLSHFHFGPSHSRQKAVAADRGVQC